MALDYNSNCYIFDFDGTVIDSNLLKRNALVDYGFSLGLTEIEVLEVLSHNKDRYETISLYHEKKGTSLDKTTYQKFDNELFSILKNASYIDGAREFIRRLSYQGKSLYLVSLTPNEQLQRIVGELDLHKYFCQVRGTSNKCQTVKDILNIEGDALMIGDQLSDYKIAESLSLSFLGVCSPGSSLTLGGNIVRSFKFLNF